MKCISWNVNGLRACVGKGFQSVFEDLDADFFCLQETKLQPGQISLELPGYHQYWNSAEKKGYSGTAIFARQEPLAVTYGLGIPELDNEGRLITLEYENFFFVTCYTPNSQQELARLPHRLRWDEAFRNYLHSLDEKKTVGVCGDLNAHRGADECAGAGGCHGFADAVIAGRGRPCFKPYPVEDMVKEGRLAAGLYQFFASSSSVRLYPLMLSMRFRTASFSPGFRHLSMTSVPVRQSS